ncbi:DsbA family protein [Candidatus Cyrtobacter comes]|uniref:DsbA family protein n=1 Tax=Candidatus Cyrtobacter comes TaxID=675776 RepID=A0ABU5L738_9RICK|nr:DsbA family protein [Candidatus Cyrtobacter comes]MDZ5761941.1 DsbA family protein [Candidatus Cyrtobacter comes]
MNLLKIAVYAVLAGLLVFVAVSYTRNTHKNEVNNPFEGTPTSSGDILSEEQIRDIVEDVIRKNPRLIINSIESYNRSNEQVILEQRTKLISKVADQIASDPMAPSVGSGDKVIIEFVDYSCIFCKSMLKTKLEALSKIGGLKIIFKDVSLLNEWSATAAKSAVAVSIIDSSKYFQFHSKLLQLDDTSSIDDINKIALSLGIDLVNLRATMDGAAVEDALQYNLDIAAKLGVNGTPAYIINGNLILGAIDVSEIKEALGMQDESLKDESLNTQGNQVETLPEDIKQETR